MSKITGEFDWGVCHASIRNFAVQAVEEMVVCHDMKEKVTVQYRKVKHVTWTEEGFARAYAIMEGIPYQEKEVVKEVKTKTFTYVKRKIVNVNFGTEVNFSNY